MFERLLAVATGDHRDVRARLRAIEILLDRGFGRTSAAVNLDAAEDREPTKIVIHWCESDAKPEVP